MRILFIIHELALNGAVIALLQQVQRLCTRGITVSITTPPLEGDAAALRPQFEAAGARLVSTVDPVDHDVAVGCTIFAAPMLANLVGQLPTAWWIHEGRAGVNALTGRSQGMQVLLQVNKLIFPNRVVADVLWRPLLTTLPPNRIEIVPCFVPPPSMDAAPVPKRPDRARVICVGSIYPRKRQSDLVQAVHLLRNAKLDCVLVGQGDRLVEPADGIARSDPDRFILAGGQPPGAMPGWYRSADIFCLPSEDESMPLAPIEAASYGLPVILSDLDCYRETWRHGYNALIYRVGDYEMLAWYLRMLMESPGIRRRISDAGRDVPVRFSEKRSAALFDAALEDAIGSFRLRS